MLDKLNKKIYGVIFGVLAPFCMVWLVIMLFSGYAGYSYQVMLDKFLLEPSTRSKIVTLSVLINLAFFYLFLNKKKDEAARGVIMGTLLFAPYIIYLKFFA